MINFTQNYLCELLIRIAEPDLWKIHRENTCKPKSQWQIWSFTYEVQCMCKKWVWCQIYDQSNSSGRMFPQPLVNISKRLYGILIKLYMSTVTTPFFKTSAISEVQHFIEAKSKLDIAAWNWEWFIDDFTMWWRHLPRVWVHFRLFIFRVHRAWKKNRNM